MHRSIMLLLACGSAAADVEKGVQSVVTLPEKIINKTTYLHDRFLLFVPKTYSADRRRPSPLMIFLHGMGERGAALDRVRKWGPPKRVKKDRDFPFFLVSPQCTTGEKGAGMWKAGKGWWQVDDLELLLEYVKKNYNIDEQRVYLTGLSMGGFGTWAWAAEHPEHFAAIAPICGGGDPRKVAQYGSLPIRAFHGDRDRAVPLKRSREMVDAVTKAGGSATLTVYPGVGHASWKKAYADKELYAWLLSHTRTDGGRSKKRGKEKSRSAK